MSPDMTGHPLISVVMPSYNHAAYVAAAVRSVLAQTVHDLELVIIDDGSSDSSPAILAELAGFDARVRLFARGQKGAAATINEGISLAQGKWVSIINSDDLYDVNRLQLLLEAVERGDAGWAFSRVELIDCDDKPAVGKQPDWYRDLQADISTWPTVGYAFLKLNVAITTGNLFFARRLFDLAGPFRDLQLVHDWDYALRLLYHSEPSYVDQPLYLYRLHTQNTIRSIAQTTTDREVAFILREFLLSVIAGKPDNARAPNPYSWPGYFEAIVHKLDFQGKSYRNFMPSQQERSFLMSQPRQRLQSVPAAATTP